MTDDVRGWRAIPPALMLAFALDLGFLVVRLVFTSSGARWALAEDGVALAVNALAMFGLIDLARRLSGREGQGLRIAMAGFAGKLALVMVGGLVLNFTSWSSETIFTVDGYLWFAAKLAVPIGLAIAAWKRAPVLVAVAVVARLADDLPPPLARAFYGWLDLGVQGWFVLDSVLRAVGIVLAIAVVATVARGAPTSEPARAVAGLRRSASALKLRVIAAVVMTGLTLLVIAGKSGEGAVSMLKLAMMAGAVINIVAMVLLALGTVEAARSGLGDLPRWPLLLSSVLAMWCVGVLLAQLPYLYRMLYAGDREDDYAQAWSVGLPLIATAGIALIAVAVSGLASRRGDDELRAEASGKGAGFVLLMLVSVAIQTWWLPKADSLGVFVGMTLCAAVAGLYATLILAKLCDLAAVAVDREPGLPTAKLV